MKPSEPSDEPYELVVYFINFDRYSSFQMVKP
jgi:hypothetical protein